MTTPPPYARHPYAEFLDRVEKPARYAGGEVGARIKGWDADALEARVCLAFPDVYDIGMSHLGTRILYKVLNDDPRTLAERCFCPWVDMERELRARGLPLVSLETARPLSDFDVVGFSLQFELTYTNVLGMLELGGIPLRSEARGEDCPLVIAGGPTATHPEPLAPFLDAIVIGDGEQKATEVALTWARLKKEGLPRRERLVRLARLGAVYVPSLYATKIDPDTGFEVVDRPLEPGVPSVVDRAMVDLADYPFPDDGPSGGPEAIFDRMSIEIARGCTEGCRFCQAGMIYRPVRERSPEEVADAVVRSIEKSGHDEVSLTALSTADVSCISPLIKTVAKRLAETRASLSVASLRAYGLEPDLLDELRRFRAGGLTFAPEAGTQRMRDVVNKNVTEEQLLETSRNVFSKGWSKMKLYFMIGLPTETDEDVLGIAETGARAAQEGKRAAKGRAAGVTVSVSTHVPKPHTPFQWAAMDSLAEVARKQRLLLDAVRPHRAVTLKTHDARASVLEGVFARGDRRLADVLERAFRGGARFDSWDERLRLDVWKEAFEAASVSPERYLGTIPTSARLPWDHIDVGLEEGFLAREYRKALQSRLSPPCGKVAGTFVHHAFSDEARADARKLVCYDCGVACDLTRMREERIEFLDQLGSVRRLPLVSGGPAAAADEEEAPEPSPEAPPTDARLPGGPSGHRYRFRFEKIGRSALLGHLDMVRELPRAFRRAGERMVYTAGFHPKPDMSFAPALPLGVPTLDEYVDVRLERELDPRELEELLLRMNARVPEGLRFVAASRLEGGDPAVTKACAGARYVIAFSRAALENALPGDGPVEARIEAACARAMAEEALPFRRETQGIFKVVDVRRFLLRAGVGGEEAQAALARVGLVGDLVALDVDVAITGSGAVRAGEVAAVVLGAGAEPPPHKAVRAALFGGAEPSARAPLLDLPRLRKPKPLPEPRPAAEA